MLKKFMGVDFTPLTFLFGVMAKMTAELAAIVIMFLFKIQYCS